MSVSKNLRLSCGASLTSLSSSGEKNTTFKLPSKSPILSKLTPLTLTDFFVPFWNNTSMVFVPLVFVNLISKLPLSFCQFISSDSLLVLGLLPMAPKKIASKRLVLPWPFFPTIKFIPFWKFTISLS